MMEQPRIEKFNFFALRDFSKPKHELNQPDTQAEPEEEEEVTPTAPPPPPTFSEAELKAAQEKSRAEGYQQGLQDGQKKAESANAERETTLVNLLGQWCHKMDVLQTEHRQALVEKKADVARLAMEIARHVAGEALHAQPDMPVTAMIEQCLPLLVEEPKVRLVIHPAIAETLRAKLPAIQDASGFEGTILLQEDDSLSESDCRICWKDGEASSKLNDIWQQVEERILQTPAPATPAQTTGAIASEPAIDSLTDNHPQPSAQPGSEQDLPDTPNDNS